MANPPFNLKDWRDENELTDDYNGLVMMFHQQVMQIMLGFYILFQNYQKTHWFFLANGALSDDDTFELRKIIERFN